MVLFNNYSSGMKISENKEAKTKNIKDDFFSPKNENRKNAPGYKFGRTLFHTR